MVGGTLKLKIVFFHFFTFLKNIFKDYALQISKIRLIGIFGDFKAKYNFIVCTALTDCLISLSLTDQYRLDVDKANVIQAVYSVSGLPVQCVGLINTTIQFLDIPEVSFSIKLKVLALLKEIVFAFQALNLLQRSTLSSTLPITLYK